MPASTRANIVTGRRHSVANNGPESQKALSTFSDGIKMETTFNSPAVASALQNVAIDAPPSRTSEGHTLLTLIASPGVNSHFPDSSTRTLFDEVEGATRRLVGGSASTISENPTKHSGDRATGVHAGDGESLQIFSHSKSQQDLYTLPHRELSDALVKIYRERIHSSE